MTRPSQITMHTLTLFSQAKKLKLCVTAGVVCIIIFRIQPSLSFRALTHTLEPTGL